MATGGAPVQSTSPTSPRPVATPLSRVPTSPAAASQRPTATATALQTPAPAPPWGIDAEAALACDGPPLGVGGSGSPVGEPGWGSAQEAVAGFLRTDGKYYAWLPLRNYVERETLPGWALLVHEVDGRAKAALVAEDLTFEGWTLSGVAACDPAELAPGEPLILDLVIWTDGDRRVPTTELTERADCDVDRILRVRGKLFGRLVAEEIAADESLGTPALDVPVPSDAVRTPYRDGSRSLWIAGDGNAAFVGSAASAERWPRIAGDEIQRTDCN